MNKISTTLNATIEKPATFYNIGYLRGLYEEWQDFCKKNEENKESLEFYSNCFNSLSKNKDYLEQITSIINKEVGEEKLQEFTTEITKDNTINFSVFLNPEHYMHSCFMLLAYYNLKFKETIIDKIKKFYISFKDKACPVEFDIDENCFIIKIINKPTEFNILATLILSQKAYDCITDENREWLKDTLKMNNRDIDRYLKYKLPQHQSRNH